MLERVQRFNVGDRARVSDKGSCHAGAVITISEAIKLPMQPPGFSHCAGRSAKYHAAGYDYDFWDWQLEATQAVQTSMS